MPLSTRETGDADKVEITTLDGSRPARQSAGVALPGIVTLAGWRVHQTWRLLLITGIGILAAVMLVCTVPLYSEVSMSAGLRGVLSTSYQSSDVIVQSISEVISKATIERTAQQLDTDFQNKLGPYLKPVEFSVQVPVSPLFVHAPNYCSGPEKGPIYDSCNLIQFVGASMEQASSHVRLLQGRLPANSALGNTTTIEIALTQESATNLHVTVGSYISTGFGFGQVLVKHVVRPVALHVVGIFTLLKGDDPYWHGNTYISVPRGLIPGSIYTALASNDALLTYFDKAFADPSLAQTKLDGPLTLLWYYPLDPSRIVVNNLNDILGGVNSIQVDVGNNPLLNQSPLLEQTTALLPSDILSRYHDRIAVAQIPVLSLLVFVLGLVLFFVSMMADFLVERQSDSISILRSRGASRPQIFGSFAVQSIVLGGIALILGPLLAVLLVFLIISRTLSPADQGALAIISGNPEAVAVNLGGYALVAVVASIIAMVIAIYRAMQLDILAIRREAARSTRRPIWQRINLDIVAIIITLTGFGISYYVTNSGVLDPQLRLLLLSPLTLLGTVFLMIAALLLFLRIFQLLLRLGAWLAARGRGAASMLALAQMARSPRQSVRTTLLFALATAFVIFTLIFTASQAERIPQVAAFSAGADFSGVPDNPSLNSIALDEETNMYRTIPGLASVTLGYKAKTIGGGNILALAIEVMAVDANNFASTAGSSWTGQDSPDALSSLMSQLRAGRSQGIASNVVPAIVDSATWTSLHLSPNTTFALNFFPYGPITLQAVAEVVHIPTISDSASVGGTDDVPSGGVLVDYRTFAPVYTNNFAQLGTSLPINYAWVRARDDSASIASVRKALTTGCCFILDPLYDRRAIVTSLQNDPLSVDLLGVLGIGATTAMLLALAGSLIASWLSARNRLTNFAVLRALGAAPSQLAGMLMWEQSIIYITSLLLGLLFGALLSLLALPVMIFTSVATTGASSDLSSSAFFIVQNIPPIQIVLPSTLWVILGALVGICIVALGLMVRVVSRPSISQTLRLNED